MKNTVPGLLMLLTVFLISCKCRFEYNIVITGYDATKCTCCFGYKISYYEYDVEAKKQVEKKYIAKVLTGDLGMNITPKSKFPIRGMGTNIIQNGTCSNVLDSVSLYPPMEQCPK